VDLIVSPTTVALNPQQGAAVPALKIGDIIEAKVLELLGQSIAKLAVGKSIIEVQTQVPLTPGTTVRLAVRTTPDGLRLTLLPPAPNAGASSASTNPIAAAPQGATSTPAGDSLGLPAQPPAAGAVAGGNASNPGAIAVSTTAPEPQLATPAQAPNPVVVAQAAVATAVQTSAARQGGLAPLLADAEVAASVPALPEAVRQAVGRLLGLQPTLDETISADSLKQALGRSGLFLEARLASAAGGATPSPAAPAGSAIPASVNDVKAALIVLRNVLKTWLVADPSVAPTPGAAPRPAALAELARAALASPPPQAGAPAVPAAPDDWHDAAPRPSAPPPPYRGAPTAAQPAAAPSISAGMTPRDIGKVLLGETDAAIARQTLLQAASLPDHLTTSSANLANTAQHLNLRVDPTGPRWLFEVPFATPQGSTVAQFEIARDGHRTAVDGVKPAWRARFSLDLEPIGPVHAQIAVTGTRAAVTLWAERPDTSAKLRDNAGQLAEALRQAELEPSDVLVRAGSPPRPPEPVAAGRFLDRAS
jgi:Flagellar hook-length control protein FliK